MPRTAHCPTCDTNVRVPDGTKRGSFVRCPSCEETFQPSFLKPMKVVVEDDDDHDLETAEAFKLAAPRDGEPPKTRADHAKEAVRRQINRERSRPAPGKPRWGWFEGIEGFFLLSALVLAAGIPLAFFGMRRLTTSTPMLAGGIVVAACLILAGIGAYAKWVVWARRMRDK